MRIVDRVKTTGYITLSLRDREKVNVGIMETTELNIMENPACLAILSRHSFFAQAEALRATAGYPVKIS
jgi:hypothetical protein